MIKWLARKEYLQSKAKCGVRIGGDRRFDRDMMPDFSYLCRKSLAMIKKHKEKAMMLVSPCCS